MLPGSKTKGQCNGSRERGFKAATTTTNQLENGCREFDLLLLKLQEKESQNTSRKELGKNASKLHPNRMTDARGLKQSRDNFQLKILYVNKKIKKNLDPISINYMWDGIFKDSNYTESLLESTGKLEEKCEENQANGDKCNYSRKYKKLYKKEILL